MGYKYRHTFWRCHVNITYQYFENYKPEIFQKLAKLFSKTALEVCEGQQYDIDFETRDDVTIPEYLK